MVAPLRFCHIVPNAFDQLPIALARGGLRSCQLHRALIQPRIPFELALAVARYGSGGRDAFAGASVGRVPVGNGQKYLAVHGHHAGIAQHENAIVVIQHIDIAHLINAKGGDARVGVGQFRPFPNAIFIFQPPNPAGNIVPVKIDALHAGKDRAAVDIAAGHGKVCYMRILFERHGQAILIAVFFVIKAVAPFHDVPAVIFAPAAGCLLKVNLFIIILTHVANIKITRQAVERVAPRVAQPVGPNLIASAARPIDQRVIRRNAIIGDGSQIGTIGRIAILRFHIQPQNGAPERTLILAIAQRIFVVAAIAQANVQIAIRPKSQLAAVVVMKGLIQHQNARFAGGISHIGVAGQAEFGHHRIAFCIMAPRHQVNIVAIVHIKHALVLIIGRKSHAQKATFTLCINVVANI